MLRLCQRIINFRLVSGKIAHNSIDYHKDPTIKFVSSIFLSFSIL